MKISTITGSIHSLEIIGKENSGVKFILSPFIRSELGTLGSEKESVSKDMRVIAWGDLAKSLQNFIGKKNDTVVVQTQSTYGTYKNEKTGQDYVGETYQATNITQLTTWDTDTNTKPSTQEANAKALENSGLQESDMGL